MPIPLSRKALLEQPFFTSNKEMLCSKLTVVNITWDQNAQVVLTNIHNFLFLPLQPNDEKYHQTNLKIWYDALTFIHKIFLSEHIIPAAQIDYESLSLAAHKAAAAGPKILPSTPYHEILERVSYLLSEFTKLLPTILPLALCERAANLLHFGAFTVQQFKEFLPLLTTGCPAVPVRSPMRAALAATFTRSSKAAATESTPLAEWLPTWATNIQTHIQYLFLEHPDMKPRFVAGLTDTLHEQNWWLVAAEYFSFKDRELDHDASEILTPLSILCITIDSFLKKWTPSQTSLEAPGRTIKDPFIIRFARCLAQDFSSDDIPRKREVSGDTFLTCILETRGDYPGHIDFLMLFSCLSFCFSVLTPRSRLKQLPIFEKLPAIAKTRLLDYLIRGRLYSPSSESWLRTHFVYLRQISKIYNYLNTLHQAHDKPVYAGYSAQLTDLEKELERIDYVLISQGSPPEFAKLMKIGRALRAIYEQVTKVGVPSGSGAGAVGWTMPNLAFNPGAAPDRYDLPI